MLAFKAIVWFAAALAATQLAAENMVFNAGFELGAAGFDCGKYLRPDTNPGLKYEKPLLDETTAASGGASLKISNRFAEQGKIVLPECKLEPGKEYVFSFSAKSESPNCPVTVCFTSVSHAGWDVAIQTFKTDKEWRAYEMPFKPKPGWDQPIYSLRIEYCHDKASKPGALWLDSLQLRQASDKGPWSPFADVEAASFLEKSVFVIPDEGSQALLSTRLANNSDKKAKAALTVKLVEDLAGSMKEASDGVVIEIAKFSVELAPHERKCVETQVDLKRFGAFRIDSSVKADSGLKAASAPGYCVVAGKLERKLVDLDKDFCSGINFAGGGIIMPPSWGELETPGYLASMDQEDYVKMYADLGIRLFRDWDYGHPAFAWREIEPEQGRFDFSLADKTVDDALKNGIRVLPVLGGVEMVVYDKKSGRSGWPSWVEPLCTELKSSGEWKETIKLPPFELWRKYVRAVASHFKGRITHYEIVNEPGGHMNAESYMEFLRAAQEEIFDADPEAKTIGFCSTGDKGGKLIGFLGDCFKLGGLNYADILSFHPYEHYSYASVAAPDKAVASIKAMLETAKGQGRPYWMTELYYLSGKGEGSDKGLCAPQDSAQRFLTDLGEGVRQSTPLCAHAVFKRLCSNNFYSGYTLTVEHPSGALSVYNALTRIFEGATPLAKLDWGDDTICYAYERQGKPLAAFWNYGEMKGLKLKLPLNDSDAQLYDMFGNKTSFSALAGGLGGAPFYIEAKANDKSGFLEALKSAQLEAARPVEIGSARVIPTEGGGWKALVAVRNTSGKDIQGVLGVNGKGVIGLGSVDISLAAGQEKAFAVPVKLEVQGPSEIIAKLYVNGKLWDFPSKLSAQPKAYPAEQSKDPSSAMPVKIGNASFSASYDKTRLRLRFTVKDPLPSGPPNGRQPWEQDCIEIFIDAAPELLPVKHPSAYTDKVVRLFIMPRAKEGERIVAWPGGFEKLGPENLSLTTDESPDGYSASLEIPLEALNISEPLKGKLIGFEVSVDYADSVARRSSESWSSDGKACKDRLLFGFISFI